MVPINVSSQDLQENHFANTKLDNVTVPSKHANKCKNHVNYGYH